LFVKKNTWVDLTTEHKFVFPLLQNLHWPHSGIYNGITWSPGWTDVTPSPTDSTIPPPSWPKITGHHSPSGSEKKIGLEETN